MVPINIEATLSMVIMLSVLLQSLCEHEDKDDVDMLEMDVGLGGEGDASERKRNGRVGCGGMQPKYSKEGLKLFVEFPIEMEEIPGSGDRKQNLPAKKVHEIFQVSRHPRAAAGTDGT